MGCFHRAIIRFILNIERVCLEAVGNGLDGASARFGRFLKGLLYLLVVGSIVGFYYFFHFKYLQSGDEDHDNVMDLQMMIDFVTVGSLISFPFAGPLHRALGYFDDDPLQLQENLALLQKDRGTAQAISIATICCCGYPTGELLYFYHMLDAQVGLQILYVPFVFVSILPFYGNVLLVILTMRAILVRLYRVEDQVVEALERTDGVLLGNYNSFASTDNGSDHVPSEPPNASEDALQSVEMVRDWTREYRVIRKHVHSISDAFGLRMLIGLFSFTVDTTTMISNLWEELGPSMAATNVLALLLSFCSNSIMITAAFYSSAYLVTECSHHIGPKLAILAVRLHGEAPQFQVLASAFLHAPVKIHVGVFEVAPEYANAIGMWFLGLFLVVFGLKIPGAE